MAYLRGMLHGVVGGAVIGALLAPRSGVESRRRLGAARRRWTRRGQLVAAGTESGWRRAEPVVRAAAEGMGGAVHAAEPVARRAARLLVELSRRGQLVDAVVVPRPAPGTGTNGVGAQGGGTGASAPRRDGSGEGGWA